MRKVWWTLAWIAVAVLVGFNVVLVLGRRLPESHVAKRSMVLRQAPAEVWKAVSDFAAQPAWRKDLKSVERLPDRDGHPVWRENYRHMGGESLATTVEMPGVYLVRTTVDASGPVSGSWEYSVQPWGRGTRVTIIEHGEAPNPFYRYLGAKVLRYYWIDDYLKMLAAKFGERARISEGDAGPIPLPQH